MFNSQQLPFWSESYSHTITGTSSYSDLLLNILQEHDTIISPLSFYTLPIC